MTERWKMDGGDIRPEVVKLIRKLLQKSRQKTDTGHEAGKENLGRTVPFTELGTRREA